MFKYNLDFDIQALDKYTKTQGLAQPPILFRRATYIVLHSCLFCPAQPPVMQNSLRCSTVLPVLFYTATTTSRNLAALQIWLVRFIADNHLQMLCKPCPFATILSFLAASYIPEWLINQPKVAVSQVSYPFNVLIEFVQV